MSIKIMNAVWQAHYPPDPSACLVLLALADCANDEGMCWPSVSTLARKARQSERNVQRIVKALESEGVLSVDRDTGRGHSNNYYINVEEIQDPRRNTVAYLARYGPGKGEDLSPFPPPG